MVLYCLYVILFVRPAVTADDQNGPTELGLSRAMLNLLPPIVLIAAVLGSILSGAATPTEAAGVGAFGATLLALFKGQLSVGTLARSGAEHH